MVLSEAGKPLAGSEVRFNSYNFDSTAEDG